MRPESFLRSAPAFRTREFASATGSGIEVASRRLASFEKDGLVRKVTRGVWANEHHPGFSPYGLVPLLLEAEQGYVSFLSALHRHGVISQIPQRVYVATTGRGRSVRAPSVTFELIQIKPDYMKAGIEWHEGATPYAMSTAEKALLDCLYVSSRKGRKFSHFPELDFSRFRKRRFAELLSGHDFSAPIRSHIEARFDAICKRARLTR